MNRLLVFKMPGCVPCKQLEKELEGVSNVEFIDSTEDFEKALEYNIRKAPTVVILKNNVEINRFTGFKPKQEILELI